jgi:Bacterial regulatory helix-turn-helix protein, lysR family
MLSSDLLEGFLSILDAGGFSKAATQLNVSQPAISQRLRRLEVELGRPDLSALAPQGPETVQNLGGTVNLLLLRLRKTQ